MHALLVSVAVIVLAAMYVRLKQKRGNRKCTSNKRLDGKTCIVTGGTVGMGLIIAQDFASRGAKVIIACPFPEEGAAAEKKIREETANKNVIFKLLDLTKFDSVRNFVQDILKTEERLDILVNNAGAARVNDIAADGMTLVMKVNYFGHVLLTLLLLPILRKTGTPTEPSRIVNTASLTHYLTLGTPDVETPHTCGIRNYSYSKLYNIYFTTVLAKKLDSNVVVNCVDPGLVGTRIYSKTNSMFVVAEWICHYLFKTVLEGAQTALYVSLDNNAGCQNGKYFVNCQLSQPASWARDEMKATQVWEKTLQLIKLTDDEWKSCFE